MNSPQDYPCILSDGLDKKNSTNADDGSESRRKSRAGLFVSICTCIICVLVVITLMLAVLLLHDKEEVQGYDYPMYQVLLAEVEDEVRLDLTGGLPTLLS